jgi:hypothetical protein
VVGGGPQATAGTRACTLSVKVTAQRSSVCRPGAVGVPRARDVACTTSRRWYLDSARGLPDTRRSSRPGRSARYSTLPGAGGARGGTGPHPRARTRTRTGTHTSGRKRRTRTRQSTLVRSHCGGRVWAQTSVRARRASTAQKRHATGQGTHCHAHAVAQATHIAGRNTCFPRAHIRAHTTSHKQGLAPASRL